MSEALRITPEWCRRTIADDPDDLEGCAHCGAVAGCCADFPNCPGGAQPRSSAMGGDAFEKWWREIPEEDRGEYSDMRLAFGAGLRLAAEIANAVGQIGQASAEGTVQVDPMAKRISVAILNEVK